MLGTQWAKSIEIVTKYSRQISVSEISRFFDLENARLKMDDLEISRDLEIWTITLLTH